MDLPEKQENLEVKWTKNKIIRHKQTGHPYLVLHVYKNVCSIIVDLEDSKPLSTPYALLPKEYYHYAADHEMIITNNERKLEQWEFDPADKYISHQIV